MTAVHQMVMTTPWIDTRFRSPEPVPSMYFRHNSLATEAINGTMVCVTKEAKIPTRLERALMRAIRESGLTQLELASRTDVEQATISRFLSEDPRIHRTLTLPVADRLCRVLGLRLVRRPQKRKDRKDA